MADERNALAELAERLETHIVPIAGCVGSSATGRAIADDIRTAQRIVAELAKVNEESVYGNRTLYLIASADAVEKSREIAKEY